MCVQEDLVEGAADDLGRGQKNGDHADKRLFPVSKRCCIEAASLIQ